jgi:hypothetical protein
MTEEDITNNDCRTGSCETIVGTAPAKCCARRYLIAQCPMMKEVDDVSKHVCPEKRVRDICMENGGKIDETVWHRSKMERIGIRQYTEKLRGTLCTYIVYGMGVSNILPLSLPLKGGKDGH